MRRTRSSHAAATLLIVASVALLVGMFAWGSLRGERVLGEDLCPSRGPSGVMVVAVDATDILSEAQRLDVDNHLRIALSGLPPEWKVEVWTVAPSSGVPEAIEPGICKPKVDPNGWTSNPTRDRKELEGFERRLDTQVTRALASPSSESSPILEALQAIGLRTFGSPEMANVRARRLLLVSDLIQHTPRVSLLREAMDFDAFKGGPHYQSLLPPLSGTSVEILMLSRLQGPGAADLVRWWQALFFDAGAALTRVTRIVG